MARELVTALDPALVPLLDPAGGERPGSVAIPADLSPRTRPRRPPATPALDPAAASQAVPPQRCAPAALAPARSALGAGGAFGGTGPRPSAPALPATLPLLAYHLAYVPLVLHRAVRVLCNSEATAREVHQRLGVPASGWCRSGWGSIRGKLRPLGLERRPFFLVLGRHDPHKNLERVLRAFAGLRQSDHRLAMVGPQDDRYTPRLRRLAVELGIAEPV